jgi:hypothetical protein
VLLALNAVERSTNKLELVKLVLPAERLVDVANLK